MPLLFDVGLSHQSVIADGIFIPNFNSADLQRKGDKMKKYVGCKEVEAKPMNRGDYNQYRGWTIPVGENPEDEGYLVKYSDGYESWSPKKQFDEAYRECDETEEQELSSTAIGMFSRSYRERFKAEYYQAVIRFDKLNQMLKKWDKNQLTFEPTCPRSTYNLQIRAMADYVAVLEARAVMENITL